MSLVGRFPGIPGVEISASSPPVLAPRLAHFFLLDARLAAKRLAVRLSADTLAAFLARADRSSGVMFLAAVLPPWLPNWRAIAVIAARTSAGIFTLMPSMIQLTGYAER